MKVCLILGAGPGIGSASARAFQSLDYHVALCGRKLQKLQDVQKNLSGKSSVHELDVGDYEKISQTVIEIEEEIGAVEVLHFNAYSLTPGRGSNLDPSELNESLSVNVIGALAATQAVLPGMRTRRRGSLLFTGGGFAMYPEAKLTALSVGKAALRNLIFCLNQELAPIGIHAASVTICGTVEKGTAFDTAKIAQAFLSLHQQPPGNFDAELIFTGH